MCNEWSPPVEECERMKPRLLRFEMGSIRGKPSTRALARATFGSAVPEGRRGLRARAARMRACASAGRPAQRHNYHDTIYDILQHAMIHVVMLCTSIIVQPASFAKPPLHALAEASGRCRPRCASERGESSKPVARSDHGRTVMACQTGCRYPSV